MPRSVFYGSDHSGYLRFLKIEFHNDFLSLLVSGHEKAPASHGWQGLFRLFRLVLLAVGIKDAMQAHAALG